MIYMVYSMKICQICNSEFSSGGSYRVHKYRFHRVKDNVDNKVKDNSLFSSIKVKDDDDMYLKDSHKNSEMKEETVDKVKDNSLSSSIKVKDDDSVKLKDNGIVVALGAVAVFVILAILGGRR